MDSIMAFVPANPSVRVQGLIQQFNSFKSDNLEKRDALLAHVMAAAQAPWQTGPPPLPLATDTGTVHE